MGMKEALIRQQIPMGKLICGDKQTQLSCTPGEEVLQVAGTPGGPRRGGGSGGR